MSIAKIRLTEQASAYINTIINERRTIKLDSTLSNINRDYRESITELNKGIKSINELLQSNRGGYTGIHGFTGEQAQVFLTNSMTLVRGEGAHYFLLDDNGPIDYMRDNIMIQQKACRSGGILGLDKVVTHANCYVFFVPEGGLYQIPKDFYERYKALLLTSEEIARKWRKEDYRLWLKVNAFKQNNPNIVIEPMNFRYDEIQANTINNTIQRVKSENRNVYEARKKDAYYKYRPTYKECLKVSSVSALIEGSMSGGLCFYNKLHDKKISEMNTEDAKDITLSSLKGAGMGAMRNTAVYFITNTTKISAPSASATVSAACNIAKETKDVVTGNISPKKYAENVSWVCADAAVSVAASKLGTKCISIALPGKFKILGPIICNLIIMPAYYKAKKSLISQYEAKGESENEQ